MPVTTKGAEHGNTRTKISIDGGGGQAVRYRRTRARSHAGSTAAWVAGKSGSRARRGPRIRKDRNVRCRSFRRSS